MDAINVNIKTTGEVKEEFSSGLGFNPEDIDDLSRSFAPDEKLSGKDADREHVTQLLNLQQDMSEMLIARFANNMEAFKKYIPNIYEEFRNYRPKEPLEFLCTANGIPNLYFPERNEFFYKVYDPVALCNKQVDIILEKCPFKQLTYNIDKEILGQIHHRYLNEMVSYQNRLEGQTTEGNPLVTGSCPIAIVVGVGLGYHLGHLYEKIEVANLVLIEPNTDLFFASLHAFDWANLLEFISKENRGIYLMVGQSKEQVFQDLNSYYDRHGRMLAGFMWSIIHYRSKEIDAIADQLIKDYERSYSTLGFFDDHMFGVSHALTNTINKCRFINRFVDFPEEIAKRPLCVVANGPSLSADLPFLRKVQDKVIIMACGTAIETLYNAGIKPLMYAATERIKVVAEHLSIIPDDTFLDDIVLITSDVAHPETVKMFKHMGIFGKADETFFSLIALHLLDKFININGICMMNPLVGNLGAAAACEFNFNKVYFFGLDNGTKRNDLLTHPEENIFYKKNEDANKNSFDKTFQNGYEDQVEKENMSADERSALENRLSFSRLSFVGKGNFGGDVYTSYIYRLSAKYIDIVIKEHKRPEAEFFNCSDGLILEQAKPVHSDELLEKFMSFDDYDREEFLKFMDEKKTFSVDLTHEEAEKLCQKETFEFIVNTIQKILLREPRPKTRIECVFLMQEICELINQIRYSRDRFITDFVDGSTSNMFIMILRILYLTPDEKEALKHAEAHFSYYNDFLEDCKKLYRYMPDYCAENHHVYLNGKIGFDHEDSKAPVLIPRKPYVTGEDRDNYPVRKFVKRYE